MAPFAQFSYPYTFNDPAEGSPLEFCNGDRETDALYQIVKKCDNMSIRLDTVLAFVGRTDGENC